MQSNRFALPVLALAAVLGSSACSSEAKPVKIGVQPAPGDSIAISEAKTRWRTLCSTCHGMEGKGDGQAGLALNPRPRTFTDTAWQKSVDDAHIRKIVLEGGAAVGKSPLMPANPDLADKPETVDYLVKIVRSLGS